MVTTPGIIEGVKEIVPMEGTTRERLLKFHRDLVKAAEAFFADASSGFLNDQIMRGVRPSPATFAKIVREAKLEDGSVYAAFRDKLRFHREAVAFLEGISA